MAEAFVVLGIVCNISLDYPLFVFEDGCAPPLALMISLLIIEDVVETCLIKSWLPFLDKPLPPPTLILIALFSMDLGRSFIFETLL